MIWKVVPGPTGCSASIKFLYKVTSGLLIRRRDEAFIKGGFIVIRIKNEDTRVKVAFWERLLEGLEGYEVDREDIRPFVNELRQMLDDEIRSWTSMPEDYIE